MASWTFAAPGMVAHQPQCRFQTEPRGEQPVHHDVVHALGDAVVFLHQAQGHLRRVTWPPARGIACRPYARLVRFGYHRAAGYGCRGTHR
jgi:hypothetical protein